MREAFLSQRGGEQNSPMAQESHGLHRKAFQSVSMSHPCLWVAAGLIESLHFPRSHPREVQGLMARWQTLQVPWPWLAAAPSISGAHGESSSLRRKKGHCSGVVQVTALGMREVPRLPWPRIHSSCSGGPSLPIYGESSSEARSAGSTPLSLLKAYTGRSSSDTVPNP